MNIIIANSNNDVWFNYLDYYTTLYKELPENSTFVEVGTYKGVSIIAMALLEKEHKKGIKLFTVDDFIGPPEIGGYKGNIPLKAECLGNIRLNDVEEYITIIDTASMEAVNFFGDRSIDAIYFDADHSYEGLTRDFKYWLPKMKDGAIISGHDYGEDFPGVVSAVDERFPEAIKLDAGVWVTKFKLLPD